VGFVVVFDVPVHLKNPASQRMELAIKTNAKATAETMAFLKKRSVRILKIFQMLIEQITLKRRDCDS